VIALVLVKVVQVVVVVLVVVVLVVVVLLAVVVCCLGLCALLPLRPFSVPLVLIIAWGRLLAPVWLQRRVKRQDQ